MVVSDGRVFYVYDEAPKNVAGPRRLALIARDAYNGLLLWKRPIQSSRRPAQPKSRPWRFPTQALATAGGRVYAVLKPGGPLTALDAATGRTVRAFDGAGSPTRVICHGSILVLSGRNWVCAIDPATGKPLWKSAGTALNPVIGEGKLFFQPGWRSLACRDLATGRETWQQSITSWAKGSRRLCFYHDGRLFLGGGRYGKPHEVHAVSAADGKHLWTHEGVWGGTDIYFARGLVWLKSGKTKQFKHGAALGLDPATGQVKKRILFPNYYPSGRGHPRCYANTATKRFMLLGSRGTDFVELETGKVYDRRAFCGDCGFGIVPACGLVYMAPNSCTCWRYLGGIRALAAARAGTLEPDNSPRLEKGPAFGAATTGKTSPDDWPTLRGNDWRSGITAAAVPPQLSPLWEAKLEGRISAPTVAGGSAYVASIDGHQVHALDAAPGARRWSYTAGGRVDSPPTLHEGLCLFGSRDGWVYCLRADDGKLVWRFRAARAERQIVAFGQLESTWPVHGSVLVKGGLAYVAAGRAPELDGGVTVYALEPRTGKVVWKDPSPVLADVMATGRHRGSAVYVGTWQFDPKTGKNGRRANRPHVRPGSGFLNGSYAVRKRWYNGTASGELLVFKTNTAYPKTWGFSAFAHAGKNAMAAPGKGEYSLFCRETRGKGGWSVKVPLRVRAMVLAGKTLFVAGPPDVAPPDDPWAAFDGKLGAELWAVSAEDGEKLSELKLKSVPVFDGMAAAGGRLYVATADGVLRCFGRK